MKAGAYAASMEAELNGIGCCMGQAVRRDTYIWSNDYMMTNRAGNPVIAIASTMTTEKNGLD